METFRIDVQFIKRDNVEIIIMSRFFTDHMNMPGNKHITNQIRKMSHLHWMFFALFVSTIAIILSSLPSEAEANRTTEAAAVSDSKRITMSLLIPNAPASFENDNQLHPKQDEQLKRHQTKVKNGDTLTAIFSRAGLNARDVYNVTRLDKENKLLTKLSPGQTFDITVSADNELQSLRYHIDKTKTLVIDKPDNNWQANLESRHYETRVTYSKGVINSSLFEAANEAGLSDSLTMDLAHIFGWDIDFALDIRQGDSFVVLYEEQFLEGEKIKDGNILAAEFVNQGKNYKAVRYTDSAGKSNYYADDGTSMRKAFLRSPVDFSRISSRFGKRHHPILNKIKHHKGVDYAAARGTPVKASGDGKIIWRGRKGGYGKTVIIQHGNSYSTLYGHLNNYNRKARSGSRVKQGQIIGYVGSTGRATGPHLHYEFRVNGTHRNPLTVKLPSAAPINKKHKEDFIAKSSPLLTQLDIIGNTNIALSDFQ